MFTSYVIIQATASEMHRYCPARQAAAKEDVLDLRDFLLKGKRRRWKAKASESEFWVRMMNGAEIMAALCGVPLRGRGGVSELAPCSCKS